MTNKKMKMIVIGLIVFVSLATIGVAMHLTNALDLRALHGG